MNQTNHFFNLGYGWLCKHCSAENAERKQHHARDKHQTVSAGALTETQNALPLARWTDATRQVLVCPHCSIEEFVNRA